jgi:hypothetical protein
MCGVDCGFDVGLACQPETLVLGRTSDADAVRLSCVKLFWLLR